MKTAYRLTADDKVQLQYRSLSLIELVEQIIFYRDHQALNEFHTNRTIFTYNNSKPMLFINFIDNLRKSFANREWRGHNDLELADIAYDLTKAKFTSLPNPEKISAANKKKNMKQPRTNCRYYFKAFLKHITDNLKTNQPISKIKEEYIAARAMQGLVIRHFNFSIIEAKRKTNHFWSRYYWDINSDKICVWLPKSLKGRERREWLKKNINNPDLKQPEEKERIQTIIDQKMIKERFVRFSEVENGTEPETSSFWSDSDEEMGICLAKTVANEKAANIKKLRRSIQALGEDKLKEFILCVFDNISSGDFSDGILAKKFGVSKATFSRFAGSQWFETDSNVPDLWFNTAHVLSKHNIFKEVAIETGFWKQVQNVLEKGTHNEDKKGSAHE
ncbi:MAG: hypothetical protein HF978_06355 [Desulfobacteraceae bacterium]|nr:hypothetical protein [Desulfobacteraceae bacterium]MBC2755152.1 hypothetical protein [Desulfobacteraceae bacterium]